MAASPGTRPRQPAKHKGMAGNNAKKFQVIEKN
jgi:hypothetical protein